MLLYSRIVRFCETEKVKGIPISKNFFENLNDIRQEGYVIHHSNVAGKIIRCAHPYSSEKVRENYCKTPVVTQLIQI